MPGSFTGVYVSYKEILMWKVKMIGMWEVRLGEACERGMNGRRKIKPLQISGKNLFGGEQESGDEDWEYFHRSWLKL